MISLSSYKMNYSDYELYQAIAFKFLYIFNACYYPAYWFVFHFK